MRKDLLPIRIIIEKSYGWKRALFPADAGIFPIWLKPEEELSIFKLN